MDKTCEGFKHLRTVYPGLSDAKLKEGVFLGPQFRKVISDKNVDTKLNTTELEAWRSFKGVVHGFLDNKKEANHKQLIQNHLQTYQKLGCRMSLKIHFLHSHLDFFSGKFKYSYWWTRWTFWPRYFTYGTTLWREMGCVNDEWLLPVLIREYLTTHKKKSLKR